VAKFPEAVFVLHVFKQKSQKTAHFDIELARARFAALGRSRAGK
jgi:phage-related protein